MLFNLNSNSNNLIEILFIVVILADCLMRLNISLISLKISVFFVKINSICSILLNHVVYMYELV